MTTILIIGASRGIGLELARQYAADGDRVIATARDDEGLATLKRLGCESLRVDVADPASISGLAWQIDGEQIDTAWYVAGVMCNRADATQPPTQPEFDRVMHTNVLGAMQVIPQVVPWLTVPGGRFGFVSSVMGQIGGVTGSNAWLYRVSKAALNMAVAAAQRSHPQLIMAAFHPGWVQTAMGGAQAPVSIEASAQGLRRTLASLSPAEGAAFMQYDGARLASW